MLRNISTSQKVESSTDTVGRINQEDVSAATKDVSAVEPTVFDDEEIKYLIIDWKIHTKGSRTYWKIIRVSGITEAYQSFKDMLKGFEKEDLVALCNLVKEKFSTAVPSVDKEKALWVELKRLFEPDAYDVLWKLQRHDMFMLIEKDYPLSNGVITLMLSAKLQVKEDNKMAIDLVMKIFVETNQRAETLIKMKAKKARLLDEQMAKKLHDENVEQVVAREKQEKDDLEKAKWLQQHYDDKPKNINWNVVAEQI
nr:hypothetical protein [Tanacetum cinerariifolium]